MSGGKHRRFFERRSAGDPGIIGKKVYHTENELLIGIPQLQTRRPGGGWVVITVIPGKENPVHLFLDEVLVEVAPHLNVADPPPTSPDVEDLDQRDISLHPAGSEHRQKLRERGDREGAQDQAREEGVSGEEEALPSKDTPDPPPDVLRPSGPVLNEGEHPTDVTVHPRGREFGRKSNPQDDAAPSGGTSTTTGGSTMASVAEVKAAIEGANEKAFEGVAAARAAVDTLGEAQQSYLAALAGSGHPDISSAHASVNHAIDLLEQAVQAVMAATEQAGGYAANL